MPYILQTNQLTKSIGGKNLVTNVSMHVKKGEIYGFLGPNTYYTSCVYVIGANNKIGFSNAYDKNGVRPAFCVPGDCKMETDQDGHRVLQQRQ